MRAILQRQFQRSLHLSKSVLQSTKYLFYDTVNKQNESKLEYQKELKEKEEKAKVQEPEFVFEGNSASTEENIKRIQNIFGGSLVGEKAGKSSSRYFTSDSCTIAGITVPEKPKEPDNCCMSGCINCVWELYNDDLKQYRAQRKLAAEKLKKHGGIWPLKYNPPIKWLNKENLPFEVRNKLPLEINKIIADQEYLENNDRWESVAMLAFAKFEKNLKSGKP